MIIPVNPYFLAVINLLNLDVFYSKSDQTGATFADYVKSWSSFHEMRMGKRYFLFGNNCHMTYQI